MITVSMVNPRIINISVVSLYARCHHRLQSWPPYIARNYHLLIMHRLLLNNHEFVQQESRFASYLRLMTMVSIEPYRHTIVKSISKRTFSIPTDNF